MKKTARLFESEPFSVKEIKDAEPVELAEPQFLKAADGIDLAFYRISPGTAPAASVIFIHGAGAHCHAPEYQRIGYELAGGYGIESWLIDIRGHGNSGGPRGDAPGPVQVWRDVKSVMDHVKSRNGGIPAVLCGHSAGGAIAINYAAWKGRTEADGYITISPYLGYKAGVSRNSVTRDNFARTDIKKYVINKLSLGILYGHAEFVYYNYTEEQLLKDPLKINSITVNMADAVTLWNPAKEFKMIKRPFAMYIGGGDELFDPVKAAGYFDKLNPGIKVRSEAAILEGEKHLSILLAASRCIGDFITKKLLPGLP